MGKVDQVALNNERSTTTMVVVSVVGCGALGSRVAGELAICGHRVPDIARVITFAKY